jgi:phosphocarrier protein
MMELTVKITNAEGLHARPARLLVSTANQFRSDIFAQLNDQKVTLKSILGVLSLGAEQGDVITFIANGEDEAQAISALQEAIAKSGVGVVYE